MALSSLLTGYAPDPRVGGGASSNGYAPGTIPYQVGPDGLYYAVNPRTGQPEQLLNDNDTSRLYFASDGNAPQSAQPAGTPQFSVGQGWGSALDTFMGNIGVPLGLAAIGGAAALPEAGAGAAAAGGTAGAGGSGAAAAGGGGALPSIGYGTLPGALDYSPAAVNALASGAGGATGAALGSADSGAAGVTGLPTAPAPAPMTAPGLGGGVDIYGQPLGTAGAGTVGAGMAGGSVLSRLTGGNADLVNLAGTLGAAGLGAYSANEYSNRLQQIYNDMASKREPYRTKSLEYLNDPNAYISGPGQTALQGVLRGLSVHGNPIDNPTSLGIATNAAMQDWRNAVTGFGNLGLSGEDTRAQVASNAAGAGQGVYDAAGYALGNLTRPKRSLSDLLGGLY